MVTIQVKATGPLFDSRELTRRFDREIQAEVAQLGALAQRLVIQGTPPAGSRPAAAGSWARWTSRSAAPPTAREAVVSSSVFYAPIVEECGPPSVRLIETRMLGQAGGGGPLVHYTEVTLPVIEQVAPSP